MVGRGELGLLMASVARDEGLVNDEAFSVVVWGLLLSTVISPFVFGHHLKRRKQEWAQWQAQSGGADGDDRVNGIVSEMEC